MYLSIIIILAGIIILVIGLTTYELNKNIGVSISLLVIGLILLVIGIIAIIYMNRNLIAI